MSTPARAAGRSHSSAPKRLLVVNGDDFGLARGINEGIIQSHELQTLTEPGLREELESTGVRLVNFWAWTRGS